MIAGMLLLAVLAVFVVCERSILLGPEPRPLRLVVDGAPLVAAKAAILGPTGLTDCSTVASSGCTEAADATRRSV